MKRKIALLLIFVLALQVVFTGCSSNKSNGSVSNAAIDQLADPEEGDTIVWITVKDFGVIKVRFFEEAAPKSVENFVTHAKNGYYNGLTFHRVINNYMIQGGDPKGDGTGGESIWGEDFEIELSSSLLPMYGALCMARLSRPVDSNSSQFFIVQQKDKCDKETMMQYVDYYGLMREIDDAAVENYNKVGGSYSLAGGYTVFGQVYEGMDVVEAIAKIATDSDDKPLEDVIIEKMEVVEYK